MFQIPSIFRREASGDSERGAPVHPPDRIHVCPDRPSTQEIPTFGGGVSRILGICCPFAQGGVCTYGSGRLLRGGVICLYIIAADDCMEQQNVYHVINGCINEA